MILLIHNQYRTLGGEERVVDDLSRLIPEYLGEEVELLQRSSSSLSGGKAALALARGGIDPTEVTGAVTRTGARVVHGHNLLPAFGWRAAPASGEYAICSARLSADKGVDVAIDACARAGRPLVLTGQGPDEAALRAQAARLGSSVTFAGRVPDDELARLRAGAALAIVPSRFAETFGLSAAEAMAAALPVAATSAGALVELLPAEDLSVPGSVESLTASIEKLWGDEGRGAANAKRIEEIASPAVVAAKLAAVYDG